MYEVDGRRYTTDGVKGDVFTFSGVAHPLPSRIFGLPGRPPLPRTAGVRITNAGPGEISAFSVDPHGEWRWQAEIPPGRTSTEVGIVGLDWVITSHSGAVLDRFTIQPGENRVTMAASSGRREFSDGYSTVRIENNSGAFVAAYSIDQ